MTGPGGLIAFPTTYGRTRNVCWGRSWASVTPMDFLWGLIVAAASAWFCYFIAERNAMSKIGWPVLGFFLPLIGIVATLVVAYTKQKDPV